MPTDPKLPRDNTDEVRAVLEDMESTIEAYIESSYTLSLVTRRLIQIRSRMSDLLIEIQPGGYPAYARRMANTQATSDARQGIRDKEDSK